MYLDLSVCGVIAHIFRVWLSCAYSLVWRIHFHAEWSFVEIFFNPRTSKGGGGGGLNGPSIGFSELKFEAFKQSK